MHDSLAPCACVERASEPGAGEKYVLAIRSVGWRVGVARMQAWGLWDYTGWLTESGHRVTINLSAVWGW